MASSRQSTRIVHSYDPFADVEARFADWEIRYIDLGGRSSELIAPGTRTVYIDVDAFAEDPEHALAHVVAHLDLHLDQLGVVMTAEQEAEANDVASIRLDRAGAR